eukprot:4529483-Prymnesium_polylepis.1
MRLKGCALVVNRSAVSTSGSPGGRTSPLEGAVDGAFDAAGSRNALNAPVLRGVGVTLAAEALASACCCCCCLSSSPLDTCGAW